MNMINRREMFAEVAGNDGGVRGGSAIHYEGMQGVFFWTHCVPKLPWI